MNPLTAKHFLETVFATPQGRKAIAEIVLLDHNIFYCVFNADEDPVVTLHERQVLWMIRSMNGETGEYWRVITRFHPVIPYEPTDAEYDIFSNLYFGNF